MHILNKCVLLLKSQRNEDDSDEYESLLEHNGFKVLHVKTIDFNYINQENLKEKLNSPDLYSGIIFPSPRSIYAIKAVLNEDRIHAGWVTKDNYVVGETTYRIATQELSLTCQGQQTGNANNLADYILKEGKSYNKPFLFVCGNLKMDILKERLAGTIELEDIIVYETITNPNIGIEFSEISNNLSNIPEYVVFFSPSGVRATINYIKRIENFDLVKFIAIGPTTESAMSNENLKVYKVLEKPTPTHLLEAIFKT